MIELAKQILTDQLIDAVQKGDFIAVKTLLKQGADQSAKMRDGQSVLGFASKQTSNQEEYGKIVKTLLKHGADPNSPEPPGCPPPLFLAVSSNNVIAVSALLSHKADPNHISNDETPLSKAAMIGNKKIGKLLVKHGADPTFTNKRGLYPVQIAKSHNHLKFAKVLPKVKSQTWFIDRIQKIFPSSRPKGDCFAVAHVGIQAALARDIPKFNNRFNRIGEIPTLEIPTQLSNAKNHEAVIVQQTREKVRQEIIDSNPKINPRVLKIFNQELEDADRPLTSQESKLRTEEKEQLGPNEKEELALIKKQFSAAFGERLHQNKLKLLTETEKNLLEFELLGAEIKLYQQPETFSILPSERSSVIHAQKAMKLLQPAVLDEKGGIARIDNFSSIYEEKEMETHFYSLKTILNKSNMKEPFTMLLCSDNHAISVVYDPKYKNWTLIDANQYPIAQDVFSEQQLAEKICRAFFSKNHIAAFSTQVYVTGADAKQAMECIDKWKKQPSWQNMHTYSPERSALKTSDGCTWAGVADYGGDKNLASQVQQKSFFKRNWKVILGGAILGGIALAGLGLVTFGVGPLIVAGVAAGVVLGGLGGLALGKAIDARNANLADKLNIAAMEERKVIEEIELTDLTPQNQERHNDVQKKVSQIKDELPVVPMGGTTKIVNDKLFTSVPDPPSIKYDSWAQTIIANDPSYREGMNRKESESMLQGQPPYTYILRDASKSGLLAISYLDNNKQVQHMLCEPSEYGTCTTIQEVFDQAKDLQKLPRLTVVPLVKEQPQIEKPQVETQTQTVESGFKFIMENNLEYRGAMDRREAEEELLGKPPGTYLIRDSSVKGAYALSLITNNGTPFHILCSEQKYSHCKDVQEIFAMYVSEHPNETKLSSIQLLEKTMQTKMAIGL